jgi:hypothetical protein
LSTFRRIDSLQAEAGACNFYCITVNYSRFAGADIYSLRRGTQQGKSEQDGEERQAFHGVYSEMISVKKDDAALPCRCSSDFDPWRAEAVLFEFVGPWPRST